MQRDTWRRCCLSPLIYTHFNHSRRGFPSFSPFMFASTPSFMSVSTPGVGKPLPAPCSCPFQLLPLHCSCRFQCLTPTRKVCIFLIASLHLDTAESVIAPTIPLLLECETEGAFPSTTTPFPLRRVLWPPTPSF